MSGRLPDVTDAELAVLRHLWEHGTSTRRQLTDALYPDGGPAHYTTVQKLLERLEGKGYVRSELAGLVRVFAATVERDDLIRRRLRDVAEKLCDGSVAPLLMNLVEAGSVSDAELAELKALVCRLARPSDPKSPKK
jgi:predicted transcriptional regulator